MDIKHILFKAYFEGKWYIEEDMGIDYKLSMSDYKLLNGYIKKTVTEHGKEEQYPKTRIVDMNAWIQFFDESMMPGGGIHLDVGLQDYQAMLVFDEQCNIVDIDEV